MSKRDARVRMGVIGVGWVGAEVARAALEDPRVELVGVVDSDPAKSGRDLGAVIGEGRIGIEIDAKPKKMIERARPEVVVVSTSSSVEGSKAVILACLRAGVHVVTTAEGWASPASADEPDAESVDRAARKRDLVVLATGVNPGFAMDRLPLTLCQVTRGIRRVRVKRVVDVGTRRAQLQAKVGVGLSKAKFKQGLGEGTLGHVGLDASIRLLARGLGWELEAVSERIEPLLATEKMASPIGGEIAVGSVRGVHQIARGHKEGQELISLELVMALGEPNPMTTIDVVGEPPLHLEVELPGDSCTVAAVLSAVPKVRKLKKGLRTVLDLPC